MGNHNQSRALFHTGRPQPITCPLSHWATTTNHVPSFTLATTTNHVPSFTLGDHNQSRALFHTGRPQPITCPLSHWRPQPITCPLSHRTITTNHGNTNLLSWLNCNPVTMQTLRLYFSFNVSTKVAWLAVLAVLFLMTLLLVSMAIHSH